MQLPNRVYAQIDLDAICQNIQNIMQKVGATTDVMAVIKADAYGHGAVPVARALTQIDTRLCRCNHRRSFGTACGGNYRPDFNFGICIS